LGRNSARQDRARESQAYARRHLSIAPAAGTTPLAAARCSNVTVAQHRSPMFIAQFIAVNDAQRHRCRRFGTKRQWVGRSEATVPASPTILTGIFRAFWPRRESLPLLMCGSVAALGCNQCRSDAVYRTRRGRPDGRDSPGLVGVGICRAAACASGEHEAAGSHRRCSYRPVTAAKRVPAHTDRGTWTTDASTRHRTIGSVMRRRGIRAA
jgi:hypothetical protein